MSDDDADMNGITERNAHSSRHGRAPAPKEKGSRKGGSGKGSRKGGGKGDKAEAAGSSEAGDGQKAKADGTAQRQGDGSDDELRCSGTPNVGPKSPSRQLALAKLGLLDDMDLEDTR